MPVEPTAVDALYEDFVAALGLLDEANEISLRSTLDSNFRKILLLAAASHFERSLTLSVLDFVEAVTSRDHVLKWLVERGVVERKYHTWFDWNGNNANRFFSLFGESFKRHMSDLVKGDPDRARSIQAFMEIGRERNRVVHQDYVSVPLEKTTQEIHAMYREAAAFVAWFPEQLAAFNDEHRPTRAALAGSVGQKAG